VLKDLSALLLSFYIVLVLLSVVVAVAIVSFMVLVSPLPCAIVSRSHPLRGF